MNTGQLTSTLKEHQLVVFGTLAGAIAAWFLVFRKTPTPVVNVTAPVTNPAGGPTSNDTTNAIAALASSQQQLAEALLGYYQAPATQPTPPASAPTPAPPPDSTGPVFSGDPHIGTVTGDTGNVYSLSPSYTVVLPHGATVTVRQMDVDGVTWWHIEQGGYSGYVIRYHDPDWSIAPGGYVPHKLGPNEDNPIPPGQDGAFFAMGSQ